MGSTEQEQNSIHPADGKTAFVLFFESYCIQAE
jgi:hypothetical protein